MAREPGLATHTGPDPNTGTVAYGLVEPCQGRHAADPSQGPEICRAARALDGLETQEQLRLRQYDSFS